MSGNKHMQSISAENQEDVIHAFTAAIPVLARIVPETLAQHASELSSILKVCTTIEYGVDLKFFWESCLAALELIKVDDCQQYLNMICPILELGATDESQRARSLVRGFLERKLSKFKEELTLPPWLSQLIDNVGGATESQTPVTPVEVELPVTGVFVGRHIRTSHPQRNNEIPEWAPPPIDAYNSQDFVPIPPVSDQYDSELAVATNSLDDQHAKPFVPLMFNSLDGQQQNHIFQSEPSTETKKRKAAMFNSPAFLQSPRPSKSLRTTTSVLPTSSPRLGASSPVRRAGGVGMIQLNDLSSSPSVSGALASAEIGVAASIGDKATFGDHIDHLLSNQQLLDECDKTQLFSCQRRLISLQSLIAERIERLIPPEH
ncbi:hypothetical protein M427DRAFT_52962 [Gonapodya prolifera JEL478]|uniref:Uncharacterized protein n=1 Tax=Gonapodya prolifera (strain JEL478) TaxID=1344416 RepID=A0A139AS67_GONPJ|nr:hypothetical protein M427DRAFT_52962 [Gonapodya prolifera JEL478]|eukprot:KXS19549.1 hypothetical protein M427DRAFT_52962 [Gonapodya prolifera JEL478]